MLSEDVQDRLYNWKFEQAVEAIAAQPEPPTSTELSVIEALARMFGNSGWFYGDMAVVVSAALTYLMPEGNDV